MGERKETAIVTGASRGIGKAIAVNFAREGMNLALFGRDSRSLNEAADICRESGSEVLTFSGDVADVNFVNGSVDKVLEKLGSVDHLINNAGVAVFKKFVDTEFEDFELQINTNVYGIFHFTKKIIPHFIKQGSGSVINISSLAGKNGFQFGTTYAATKHAVMGFTRSLLLEVREFNIRVAAVCPGSVATDMIINSDMKPASLEKVLDPKDIADVVSTMVKLPVRAVISEVEIRPTNPK